MSFQVLMICWADPGLAERYGHLDLRGFWTVSAKGTETSLNVLQRLGLSDAADGVMLLTDTQENREWMLKSKFAHYPDGRSLEPWRLLWQPIEPLLERHDRSPE